MASSVSIGRIVHWLHEIIANNLADTINFGAIKDGKIDAGVTTNDLLCFVFQLLTAPMPGVLNGVAGLATGALELVLSTVGDMFKNLGCPAPLNGA